MKFYHPLNFRKIAFLCSPRAHKHYFYLNIHSKNRRVISFEIWTPLKSFNTSTLSIFTISLKIINHIFTILYLYTRVNVRRIIYICYPTFEIESLSITFSNRIERAVRPTGFVNDPTIPRHVSPIRHCRSYNEYQANVQFITSTGTIESFYPDQILPPTYTAQQCAS